MSDNKKILITGGHFTPSHATMELLIKEGWEVWYIGRKYSQEKDKSQSLEYEVLKDNQKIHFLTITTGKFYRHSWSETLLSLLSLPGALMQALWWLVSIKPGIVLSFGGYIAPPVALAAFIMGIPVVTHEQTRVLGLANRLVAFFARAVCISWPDTQKLPKNANIILTGIPLRKEIYLKKEKLGLNLDKPLLYISGGSQGSHTINEALKPIIADLLKDYAVVHQIGNNKIYNDIDFFTKLKENLDVELKNRYLPVMFVDQQYIGWLYSKTYLALARSGANTVAELASIGIPAIFIPLPFAGSEEQLLNAQIFADNGAAVIIEQKNLTPQLLLKTISKVSAEHDKYQQAALNLNKYLVTNGSQNLLTVIQNNVKP